jgi:uncharacterized membrane protein YagU involved in acid resistance
MSISPITKEQWVKVLKSLAYSFVSTFVVALLASQDFSKAGLSAAAVSGFNAVLVAVKQLFTSN